MCIRSERVAEEVDAAYFKILFQKLFEGLEKTIETAG
jgi:hypothetical protein